MHLPVLVNEVLDLLAVEGGGKYIDGTVGSGGHALAILERIGPKGFLIGIDRDEQAVARARDRLTCRQEQCFLSHGNFEDMANIAASKGIDSVQGVVLDLGVSSEQLEAPERGFSFAQNGPLDMRMDRTKGEPASELINNISETELCDLLWKFGEEPMAKRIARAVVKERKNCPIKTTGRLVDLIEKTKGGKRGRIHPATRIFQGLRIAVNKELNSLEKGLWAGLNMLDAGGRIAVISFHSLEDRIVKHFFAGHVGKWESLQAGGRRWHGEKPVVRLVNRKPITPSAEERRRNPRVRSAKLRVAERVAENKNQ